MKESGLSWPLITEDEQDRQLGRYVAAVQFGDDLSEQLRDRAMKQYIEGIRSKRCLPSCSERWQTGYAAVFPKKPTSTSS